MPAFAVAVALVGAVGPTDGFVEALPDACGDALPEACGDALPEGWAAPEALALAVGDVDALGVLEGLGGGGGGGVTPGSGWPSTLPLAVLKTGAGAGTIPIACAFAASTCGADSVLIFCASACD